MTSPKLHRIADLVRQWLPSRVVLPPHEEALATHLRGNAPLYESLVGFLRARVELRASQTPPAEPIDCRAWLERDHEIRVLLNRIEFVYHSPVAPIHDDGEPPA